VLEEFSREAVGAVMWLAPTRELLEQAVDAVREVWEINPSGESLVLNRAYLTGKFVRDDRPLLHFATPQMLYSRIKSGREVPRVGYIIFDEAHHAVAPTFKAAIEELRRAQENVVALLGLSATPGRRDAEESRELSRFFNGNLITSDRLGNDPVRALRDRGVLAEVSFGRIEVGDVLPGLIVEDWEGAEVSLGRLAQDPQRFRAIIEKISDIARAEQALVFSASIHHANAITAALQGNGVGAGVITTDTDPVRRRSLIERFRKGDLSVLVNKEILAAGWDCPAASNAVLTVPVGSAITFEQIVGRVSRGPAVGGNSQSTVWEIDDHIAMHGEPSSYRRYRDGGWQ